MRKKCEICKKKLPYSERWDAYYCQHCNEWKEEKCHITKEDWEKDPHKCRFKCFLRPDTPNYMEAFYKLMKKYDTLWKRLIG